MRKMPTAFRLLTDRPAAAAAEAAAAETGPGTIPGPSFKAVGTGKM